MKLNLTTDSGEILFSAETPEVPNRKIVMGALCSEFIFYLLKHNAISKEQIFSSIAQYESIEAAKQSDERRNEEHN